MSFRTKLSLIFVLTVIGSVCVVAYGVTRYTQAAFEEIDAQRTTAIISQFKKEYEQSREQVAQQVKNAADADISLRTAIDLARPNADQSLYVHDANGAAQDHQLDFVEYAGWDGTIISSAQFPARVGTKAAWLTATKDWNTIPPFLKKEDLPDGAALSLASVRTVSGGNDKNLYIVGGRRVDQNFLSKLVLPSGMRALLYVNLEPGFNSAMLLSGGKDDVDQPDKLQPMIDQVRKQPQIVVQTIDWSSDAGSAETFHAMPLIGRNNDVLGVLLVGSSQLEMVLLRNRIFGTSAAVAAVALLIGLLLSLWIAAKITKPVTELSDGAREVAAGRWETRIDVYGVDEIGQLGIAFNDMTRTLSVQRDRLLQTERVAAWRELARRLAHELRNPLFPLQITVENLQRAKQLDSKQFMEVFNESTATLRVELANLNAIVGRFSDFSKMPAPAFTKVDVNEALRNIIRLFEPQFNVVGKPAIAAEYSLTEPLPEVDADPVLLHRAFQNLVLNALDAMPAGGTLTLRTSERSAHVLIEISDTGKGLTSEECSRLFTPYYTTKHQGTGLGLAIVQSIVSDHHGSISVSSEEGHGTTFRIELPLRQAGAVVKPRVDEAKLDAKSTDSAEQNSKEKGEPSSFAEASD
ncbi:MAG TPA: HAMP domain-containing sensor histidine kinase [Candidatus Acidoferrum sp.]|jgi:two-component system nitrogen regulation sensor histidine kinase NtrY